ncbi:MAG TPA: hypothetical protein VN948_06890 [Terriglobales bacterium]|nr:hypothetical protein [Terriglobales bacterium]
MKRFLLFVLLSAFAVSRAWCQSPNTPWLPVGLNGETGPLGALGESSDNQLTLGVTGATIYDDNSLSSNADRTGNLSYTVSPNIALSESRPRIVWSLQYGAGFSYNQKTGKGLTQNLSFTTQYRVSEKLTLELSDRFLHTDSWWTGLVVNPTAPGGDVIQQPNESVITPEAVATTNLARLNVVYQPSASAVAGVGGSFNKADFGNVISGTQQPLLDSKSGTASAYYSQRVHRSNWLGVTYTFQRILTSGQVREGADNQAAEIFYTFAPSSHTSLSLFGGPDYFSSRAVIDIVILGIPIPLTIPTSGWGASAGVTAGWRGQRTGASVKYMHRISDGGGLSGAVHSDSGTVNFRRQMSERWTANLGVNVANNDSVSILYGNSFRTISGTASLNWNLGNSLTVMLSYARDHQDDSFTNPTLAGVAGGASSRTIDRDRAWISISYHYTRPLGW